MKKAANLAAFCFALVLPAAICWYYDIYVNWQPKIYPFAVVAVLLGNILLTLLTLWVGGERKAAPFIWKTLLSTVVFIATLFTPSLLINNVMHLGATLAANVAVPLVAAHLLVLFVLLVRKLQGPVIAICLAVSCLLSFIFIIGVPYYIDNLYKAPIPVLPEGQFAPMPALGEVDFTVPLDGSMEEVRDLIREARANGSDEHFTVLIEDGEYNITQIAFNGDDYNTTYRSRDGGVILNGGMVLDTKNFTPWDNNENIKVIDLTKLDLSADGWGRMYASAGHSNLAGRYEDGLGPQSCELFYNGRRCELARWPNEGWLKTGEILDPGDFMADSGGWPVTPEEGERWEALHNPRGGTFLMDSKTAERARGWQSPTDVWMIGMFKYDWAETVTPVQSIDKEKGAVTTAYASNYGFNKGKEYRFYNVLEELDAPGEWYLDRESGLLYVWPPDNAFDSARIDLSLSTETLIAGDRVENLSFIGLILQGTRGDGIALTGGGITVDHCVIRCVGGDGLTLTGNGNTASNNEVAHVGRRGITITGGDRETLAPGDSRAVNNLVHDWTELVLTYQGGINVYGAGNLVAHNEIYHSPHVAIFFGGNNVIEYNLIHDVCLETSDAGAFYSGGVAANYGTVIHNNVVYNLGRFSDETQNKHTPNGIYLDELVSGVTAENNLLVNIPGVGIHLGGGRDLDVRGNIVVNAGRPISYDDRGRQGALFGGWHTISREGQHAWQALFSSPWQSEAWKRAYPKLAAVHGDFSNPDDPNFALNPAGSVVTGNVFVGQNKPRYDESVLRFSGIGPNEEYNVLQKYWALSGYEAIDLERVGRQK